MMVEVVKKAVAVVVGEEEEVVDRTTCSAVERNDH